MTLKSVNEGPVESYLNVLEFVTTYELETKLTVNDLMCLNDCIIAFCNTNNIEFELVDDQEYKFGKLYEYPEWALIVVLEEEFKISV